MGVQLINLGKRDAVVGMARNAEAEDEEIAEDGSEITSQDAVTEDAQAPSDVADQA